MAFFIDIKKDGETASYADYVFSDDVVGEGRLRIDKGTGEVQELAPAPRDDSGSRFQRAAMKVLQHWKAGELPDSTCWAS